MANAKHEIGEAIGKSLKDVPIHLRYISDIPKKLRRKKRDDGDGVRSIDKPGESPDLPRRDERGRFAPDPNKTTDSTYDRPSGWRSGMRERTWRDTAEMSPDGRVRDPETHEIMDPNDPWVMGHAPGHETRHHQRSARERGLTREEYREEYYEYFKGKFRPETPKTSSSGKHELPWEQYQGP